MRAHRSQHPRNERQQFLQRVEVRGLTRHHMLDPALTVCVRELRQALGDDPKAPQYIETVHRRGFRFIAPLATSPPVQDLKFKVRTSP
ncbi:MAG: winged helix-turn-helix domain-containing protein [Deltaproteobacteria bacterium]|nr:winged helix-turn-helix domain-containing protein [Deltaproteobacteria bacterium]